MKKSPFELESNAFVVRFPITRTFYYMGEYEVDLKTVHRFAPTSFFTSINSVTDAELADVGIRRVTEQKDLLVKIGRMPFDDKQAFVRFLEDDLVTFDVGRDGRCSGDVGAQIRGRVKETIGQLYVVDGSSLEFRMWDMDPQLKMRYGEWQSWDNVGYRHWLVELLMPGGR